MQFSINHTDKAEDHSKNEEIPSKRRNITDSDIKEINVADDMDNKNSKLNDLEVEKITKEKSRTLFESFEAHTGIKLKNIETEDSFLPIVNRNCENILGYFKIPIGITKQPIKINNFHFHLPIATTEGCLVASVNRGIKLTNALGGIKGYVENVGITRSFSLKFNSFDDCVKCYKWLKLETVQDELIAIGNATSDYLKIKTIESKHVIGLQLFVKIYAFTGDAMGMNMITKACQQISNLICNNFDCKLISISANICTDKKWSVENYCNSRGRRVFLNIEITEELCLKILKISIHNLYEVYKSKICLGSALVLGNFNCQAANYISSIFIALGQDVAQCIESSNCLIYMDLIGEKLNVSLWMPSIVCGTIGGGTHLSPQNEFLQQFYKEDTEFIITDKSLDKSVAPSYLALAIASAVLCGELSCMAALADNTLVDSHMRLNRK
ncbi:hydroxymethylglutaryl-CoA reductase (NADPH) [Edhazardia aedis USNM 41457]|uniref:hydroxymethylglutaryl-CoA reductase (NADPH) n=1 Tax=Edhazardia aedis (strain USNM 41457) TaxID=1003232 RepID=J9DGZ3_EDHAE|nr:hydroxymethylglutaryl-CoA reductase (NADPH) [Edhazardia aedis USNM 41457]|eukprot:EJW01875.1 hydroxymethylglutaryl-CoA reductase (NADPH) [Edhazardia aedis USNM 41457]